MYSYIDPSQAFYYCVLIIFYCALISAIYPRIKSRLVH
jgi:hypothetical protein